MNDLISRQAAIDAFLTELTKRERKNLLHTWSTVEVKYFIAKMLEQLPSAQPDLSEHSTWFRIGETLVDESKMHITAEQAVDKIRGYMIRMKKPERKKGKWLNEYEMKCSICGFECDDPYYLGEANFCPNCGADMRGDKNG